MGGPRGTLQERFWPKVDLSDLAGCWPWLGSRNGAWVEMYWSMGKNWRRRRHG